MCVRNLVDNRSLTLSGTPSHWLDRKILACFTAGNRVSWVPGEFTLPTPDFSNQENEEDTIMQQ